MSKTSGRKQRERGVDAVLQERMGRVTFLDPFGDPVFLPPADVNENASELVIRVELPGVRENEVAVFVEGENIEVVGEKKRDSCGSDISFLCLERTYGNFRRVFETTGCLNMGLVKAVLKDGVLVLCIPKCEEQRGKRRRITVATEEE
ncbi:MAG: Hsp20/alpha crystallin family protein [Thermodesulfobacteriota bacterium]|nr:Hsp20/alpha crystallin family protein [Thermodesulfobacteriota bacterium]